MQLSFKCFCGKAYLHFPDLLDHHFYEHEKELSEEAIDRLKNSQSIIGYVNKKSWVNVYGERISQEN
jgi:hypothetical protein